MTDKPPTIAELERILAGPNDKTITILPNGEIRVLDQPAQADTVYAHVERIVHALLTGIAQELDNPRDLVTSTSRIKVYSEAVQALSSWPQFNPMNSHEQYQKLAEYEVQKAIRAYQDSPKFPACDCGMGVQAPAGFHLKGCKGLTYAGVKDAVCPCGFGLPGRSLHTLACPRFKENDE